MPAASARRAKTRTTPDTATEPDPDDFIEDPDFDLPTAFEELRAVLVDVDAFASLADEALAALPYVRDPDQRRDAT